MLKKIITTILEKSDFKITERNEDDGNVLQVKLNDGSLRVSITPQHTFNVKGGTKNQNKELEEYIEKEIRLPVRDIALKKLDEGPEKWNKWRKTHGQLFIDFSELNISDKNLSGVEFRNIDLSYSQFHNVNLEGADLRSCKLVETKLLSCNLKRSDLSLVDGMMANFTDSDLSYTKLSTAKFGAAIFKSTKLHGTSFDETNLKYADLTKAELFDANLSGCIINEKTTFQDSIGIESGINGIYNAETDSAALYSQSPAGNSMKGPNIEAVLESLKRARKYFGFSFLLSIGAFLIFFLKQDATSIPFFNEFELTQTQYLIIGITFSLGLLVLTKMFLDDAFEGMKYLEDRKSAMSVGSFPWALTKFAGEKKDQIIASKLSRLILCLHPLLYIFLFDFDKLNVALLVLILLASGIGIWILIFSKNFQKPILFDSKTEEEKSKENIVDKLDFLIKTIEKKRSLNTFR